MSVYIGGDVLASKNLWKINDALDAIEGSVLVNGAASDVEHLGTDSSGNIYAAANDSGYGIWKYDSDLALDTSWGTSGEIDPPGTNTRGLSVSPEGKVAVGGNGVSHFDVEGTSLWAAEDSFDYEAVLIDPKTKNVLGFDSEHPHGLRKFGKLDGTILESGTVGGGGSASGNGLAIDRTNYTDPPHIYIHTLENTVRRLTAFDPDNLSNKIWAVSGTNYPVTTLYSTIAVDSNGNIYMVGSRVTGGFGGADYSVLKIDSSDGSILAVYDTGAATNSIAIDSDDNIFVTGTASGSKVLWKLNTSLVLQASLSTAVLNLGASLSVTMTTVLSRETVPPADRQFSKTLVALANDQVWYESSAGTMSVLSASSSKIDTADYLEAFELEQKVFIVNGSNLKIADFINVKLTHTALTTAHAHGDILTQTQSAGVTASMVVDFTNAAKTATYGYAYYTAATAFDTSTGVTGSGSGTGFTPTIVTNSPHFYDWTVYPGGSSGTMPDTAYLGCAYRGRAVISGNPKNPHQWYMFRQLNPFDLAFVANDAQTPVLGGSSNAGKIGDIVKALIPFNDDYLIFGCATSMWFLQGDPAYGGTIMSLTKHTGIFGGQAWTFDETGNLYFFGTGGLFTVKRGSRLVENLSNKRLPKLLEDEDAKSETHRVTLGFDKRRNGLVLAITTLATGANSNYWYDLQSEGMFPESYPNVCGVYSQFYYPAEDDTYADLILGGRDGYLRIFKDSAKDDDSGDSDTAISSNVLMPVQDMVLDDDDLQGRLTSMVIESGGGASGGAFGDTDSITYDIHVSKGAEELVEDVRDGATPLHTGTVTGVGRNKRIRKRAKGKYLGIVLKNTTAASTWVLEKLSIKTKPAGRIR